MKNSKDARTAVEADQDHLARALCPMSLCQRLHRFEQPISLSIDGMCVQSYGHQIEA